MPGMAPSSSHHAGVPSYQAWNSNHISTSPMEGSVEQPASSAGPFSSLGSLKVTLLLGRDSLGDWGYMPCRSPWEWLWLLALAWFLDWPLEQVLNQLLEQFLDQLLLWLWEWACELSPHSLPSLLRSLWRASAVSSTLWWAAQRATS